MKKIWIAAFSGLILLACNSSSSNNQQDSVDSTNKKNDSVVSVDSKTSEFATKAASGGMLEVQAGQMAQQKAQSQRVKDFGLMMIRDHTKANDDLKALASQKSISLPATLSDEHQKHLDDLSKKSGKDFDKAYVDLMVNDHKEDVSEFKEAAASVPDSAIKHFAANAIPILQMHLDSAQTIKKSMK